MSAGIVFVLLCTIIAILFDPPPRGEWTGQNQYKPPKPKRPSFQAEFARLQHEKRERREQSRAALETTGFKLGHLIRGAKH
jgi:hypothetical protein